MGWGRRGQGGQTLWPWGVARGRRPRSRNQSRPGGQGSTGRGWEGRCPRGAAAVEGWGLARGPWTAEGREAGAVGRSRLGQGGYALCNGGQRPHAGEGGGGEVSWATQGAPRPPAPNGAIWQSPRWGCGRVVAFAVRESIFKISHTKLEISAGFYDPRLGVGRGSLHLARWVYEGEGSEGRVGEARGAAQWSGLAVGTPEGAARRSPPTAAAAGAAPHRRR